jgi:WS/DGAT/MGAT family acyltransferase
MHVGWATTFKPPADRPAPGFEELRAHIKGRLSRDPRFRQRIASVPLGLNAPLWTDDESFDPDRHIVPARHSTLGEIVDDAMSQPLDRRRPLWELSIAERLDDGRVGVVGKAHHCMVDGIAAVELAALLLDPTPEPGPPEEDGWEPDPAPGALSRLARGLADQALGTASLLTVPARMAASPELALQVPRHGWRAARAAARLLKPAQQVTPLNDPLSAQRHLALAQRPLEDLRSIKRSFDTTINDVVLAVSAAGLRRLFERRGRLPLPLKAMVPVSLRTEDDGASGNQISFMFVDLPCDEPDPVRRLMDIHRETVDRKGSDEPSGLSGALDLVGYLPQPVRAAVSHVIASPSIFNLTVSNIPGPPIPMYMLGCELEEAYPVVPIADRHALSIGVTTVHDLACFGLYSDPELLPDADMLAEAIDESVDELLALS